MLCDNLVGGGQEGGMGGVRHVYLWLIHVDIWQITTQYCKATILQLKIKFSKSVFKIEGFSEHLGVRFFF